MKKLIMTATLTILFTLPALAKDIIPESGTAPGSRYVKVTLIEGERISFEDCILGSSSSSNETRCKFLGRKKDYSLDEVNGQKMIERLQVAGSIVTDATLGVIAYFSGGFAGMALVVANPSTACMVGSLAGVGGAGILADKIDVLNPAEQYRQAETISSDVVADHLVKVKDINAFIKRLDLVLSKL